MYFIYFCMCVVYECLCICVFIYVDTCVGMSAYDTCVKSCGDLKLPLDVTGQLP